MRPVGPTAALSVCRRLTTCAAALAIASAPAAALAAQTRTGVVIAAGQPEDGDATERAGSDADATATPADGEATDGEATAPDGEATAPPSDGEGTTPDARGEAATSADDAEATAAEGSGDDGPGPDDDDAGEDTDPAPGDDAPASTVPERLPKLQVAGWWTLFGAFALASTAGVFSGLAERQEDKAVRLASRFEDTGSQPRFSDTQGEYNKIIDRGRAYQATAIALGAVAGAVAIAAAALFIVDARRGRRSRRAAVSPTGLRVRF